MNRLCYALAVVAVAICATVILTTSAALPATVASHFNAPGDANGYMSRAEYETMMLALATGIPLSLMLLMATVPRIAPALIHVPNLRPWLDSPRRDEAIAVLGAYGAIGAILLTTCIAGVHLVVLRANAQSPPHLDSAALGLVIGGFMLAIALWVIAMALRFRGGPR
ncbi:MAG TPA: DUF1648 domain-containing protein [Casimicrobiaceae bacterium]